MKNSKNAIMGCFFDLDGTLVDTEPMWVQAIISSLDELSCTFNKQKADELIYGRSWLDIYADLCRLFPEVWSDRPELENRIDRHFNIIKQKGGFVIDSSVELLKELAKEKPIAIVSGSSRKTVGQWVEDLGLEPYIKFYMGCEEYPRGKPDPICYQMASERLGIPPESCIVFEDSNAGVNSAKTAGMYCVALSLVGARKQDLEAADMILNDLGELDCNALDETPPVLKI